LGLDLCLDQQFSMSSFITSETSRDLNELLMINMHCPTVEFRGCRSEAEGTGA
jgi:hypothetical protein